MIYAYSTTTSSFLIFLKDNKDNLRSVIRYKYFIKGVFIKTADTVNRYLKYINNTVNVYPYMFQPYLAI
jgi:hypothetical protein